MVCRPRRSSPGLLIAIASACAALMGAMTARASPPGAFALRVEGRETPPPLSVTVQRPDGSVWHRVWPAARPGAALDFAGWHAGPGTYHFILESSPARAEFSQTASTPIVRSTLELIWDGERPPPGVAHGTGEDAAKAGHSHLRYIVLTTVQQPHPEVTLGVAPGAALPDITWRVHNGLDIPIRGAGREGAFDTHTERRVSGDPEAWAPAGPGLVCGHYTPEGQSLPAGEALELRPGGPAARRRWARRGGRPARIGWCSNTGCCRAAPCPRARPSSPSSRSGRCTAGYWGSRSRIGEAGDADSSWV